MTKIMSDEIIHIIYIGNYYEQGKAGNKKLESFILEKMKLMSISKVILTKFNMRRRSVITEEKMMSITGNEKNSIRNWPTQQSNKIMKQSDSRNCVAFELSDYFRFILNFDIKKEKEYRDFVLWQPGKHRMSVQDDLDMFCEKFDNEKMCDETNYDEVVESVDTYCIQKLTSEEENLLKEKNEEYFQTFHAHSLGYDPDVKKLEMDSSESRSKYVLIHSKRETSILLEIS